MEQILARLLYTAIGNDPKTKQTVCNLLQFYRENRDLIALVLGTQTAQPAVQTPAEEQPAPQKENRPQEAVGSVSILEQYLQRAM